MYYVYVIQSKNNREIYIGSTNDLRRRIHEHNREGSSSTKRYAPWRLVYYEAYRSEIDAREREKMLKQHGQSVGHLKKRIKFSLKDFGMSEKKGLPSTFSKSAGFTLVEVLVTLFIIVLISGIIFANYRQGGQQFALQRSASKLAQDIRRMEEMAMSMKEFNGAVPAGGYGIYIELEEKSPGVWVAYGYTLFADCDDNDTYTLPSATPCNNNTSENIFSEEIPLEKNVEICGVCSGYTSTIIFTPPNPTVTIEPDPGATGSTPLVLHNSYGQQKTVWVNHAGLIWIE